MYFVGNPSYVVMPQLDSNFYYAVSNQTYQATYMNQQQSTNLTYAYSPINLPSYIPAQLIPIQNSGASILTSNYTQTSTNITQTSIEAKSSQNRPFSSRTTSIETAPSGLNTSIRRTKSGYITKSRVMKRSNVEINLHKSCPGCLKLWRKCQCSNIKNRPDPKPYCKFIPPRMLRKQNANN